ncbi:adenylate isopentenyltransferase 3, chloroplastic-like [Dioscorea cayenensis subsp. rotundata]|uniref:adenylate dimethylallyltransferase (ADP/ATP-dependent) n=1 Tax=Dioscorea cayennensis subsp. rotundata TaxID=55577 RepID=A0AB40C9Z8_DIOCR|nr:adenylate isopentenyltransferase 3, chloroplastic-like [Dioscorea cayenensis subsp. rotundata]
MDSGKLPRRKNKVIFVMGATGSGKTKLAVDLALHFNGEIINSDKMQVYDGLDIITNKATLSERAGIPHHLLGGVPPTADFSAEDFSRAATLAVDSIISRGKLPFIAGGSNTYIQALVDGDDGLFRAKYDLCFIWIAVELPVLFQFVGNRVDKMVELGLVEEARGVFNIEDDDYTRGVRRAIGVPELDKYFRDENKVDSDRKAGILGEAIEQVKVNTCKLVSSQLVKIERLRVESGWDVKRLDATRVFLKRGSPEFEGAWMEMVVKPALDIVRRFLNGECEEVLAVGVCVCDSQNGREMIYNI